MSAEFQRITSKFNSGRGQRHLGKKIAKIFPDIYGGFCIECGALDGKHLSVLNDFEAHLEWKCLNIEANSESFEALKKNRPNSTNVHYALSNVDDKEVRMSNGSQKKLSRITDADHDHLLRVQTITYKTLIEDLGIEKVHVFVLDVEGYESQAIEGMVGSVLPDLMCIEAHDKDHLHMIEVALLLLSESYSMHSNNGYNYFFIKNSYVQ